MRFSGKGLNCALAVVLATAATTAAAPAWAGHDDDSLFSNWYLKGEAGWSFGAETETDGPVSTSFDTEDDLVFGGSIGTQVANNWRVELNTSYQSNDTDAEDNPEVLGGEISALTIMPVVYYDFDLGSRFKPFLGAGAGVAMIDADYGLLSPPNEYTADGSEWTFAWQATAGVAYEISRNLIVDARYRYMNVPSYDVGPVEADYTNHAVLAGVRFLFGADPEPMPEPEPVWEPEPEPEPEPIAEPEVQQVIVYFRFDEAKITPEAAEVLDEAARVIRARGIESVKVVGYTDTSGPAKYNLWLSESRALAVRGALVERGVDSSYISVDFKGEDELRVPTGDGVKMAENRRSEVSIFFID